MKKNLNEDISKIMKEIEVASSSNKLQGYFIVLDFGVSKTLIRYDSNDFPQLLGLVQLMKADLQDCMLESLCEFRAQPDGVLNVAPENLVLDGSQPVLKKKSKPTLN